MSLPPVFIDHIDLRVSSLTRATSFYDAVLGALGMRRVNESSDPAEDEWIGWGYTVQDDGPTPQPFFGIQEEPGHRGGANRIAFAASSRQHVDRVAATALAAGALAMEGPELCTDYGPTYYAAFFEDADGNKLEVCCRF